MEDEDDRNKMSEEDVNIAGTPEQDEQIYSANIDDFGDEGSLALWLLRYVS